MEITEFLYNLLKDYAKEDPTELDVTSVINKLRDLSVGNMLSAFLEIGMLNNSEGISDEEAYRIMIRKLLIGIELEIIEVKGDN